MLRGRKFSGFAIFVLLGCGQPDREFGVDGSAGQSGAAGAAAVSGQSGALGSSGRGNAGSGSDRLPGSCETDPDCATKPEDCFNGKDDDGDGEIDCADSDCDAGAACVPASYAYGTQIDNGAACPAGFQGAATPLYGGLDAGPGCSGCGCKPTTTDCGPVRVDVYQSQSCPGSSPIASLTLEQISSACTRLSTTASGWNNFVWTPLPNFKCENTGKATLATAKWTTETTFCAASIAGGGCNAGEVCVPTARPGFSSFLASGDKPCPATFPLKQTLYSGLTDGRACKCSCEALGGSCDALILNVSGSSPDCSAATAARAGVAACASAGYSDQFSYSFTGAPTPPISCTPSDVLTGDLTPTGLQTLCSR
ncbi:MAG TPA: hypothetical protein VGC79_22870 [Polyangiaceae bacterium]